MKNLSEVIKDQRMVCSCRKMIFFITSIIIYLLFHLYFLVTPHLIRAVPVEPDDAYHSIVKAENIKNCLFDDCKALNDLYEQTSFNTKDSEVSFIQDRQKHRLLISYHPLYSIIIVALKKLGLLYENAKLTLDIAGVFFITFATAYFLSIIFSINSASIVLIMIAAWPMMGHGLHSINYYTFSTGFAFLTWGILAKEGSNHTGLINAILLLMLSAASHPIGIIYTGMSILLIVFKNTFKLKLKYILFILICLTIMYIFFKYRINFVNESIDILSVYKESMSLTEIFKNNLISVKLFLRNLHTFIGIPLTILYLLVGFITIPSNKIKTICSMGLVMMITFVGILFYPVPYTSVLYRLSPVFYVFLFGFIGIAGNWSFNNVGNFQCSKFINWTNDYFNKPSINVTKDEIKIIVSYFIVISVSITIVFSLVAGIRSMNDQLKVHINRRNIDLHHDQVSELLNHSNLEDKILYGGNESINYYYLIHGGVKRRFIWSDFVIGTNQQNKYIDENVKFLVTQSPILKYDSDVFLDNGDMISIYSSKIQIDSLFLFVENIGNDALIEINSANYYTNKIPQNYKGWIQLHLGDYKNANNITVSVKNASYRIRIGGIKFSSFERLHWPWDKDITFNIPIRDDYGRVIDYRDISFITNNLSPTKKCKILGIINDQGSSVLSKVKCED